MTSPLNHHHGEEGVEAWKADVRLVMGQCHLLVPLGTDDILMPPPNPVIRPHTVTKDGISLDHRLNVGRAALPGILTKKRHGVLVRDREAVQMQDVQGRIAHLRQDLDHHKAKNIPVELRQQGIPTVEIDQCPFLQDVLPHLLRGRIADVHLRGLGLRHCLQHVGPHHHLFPRDIKGHPLENNHHHLQTWALEVIDVLFVGAPAHVHHVVALVHRNPSGECVHVLHHHYHQ